LKLLNRTITAIRHQDWCAGTHTNQIVRVTFKSLLVLLILTTRKFNNLLAVPVDQVLAIPAASIAAEYLAQQFSLGQFLSIFVDAPQDQAALVFFDG
jgi:hypothetical protein